MLNNANSNNANAVATALANGANSKHRAPLLCIVCSVLPHSTIVSAALQQVIFAASMLCSQLCDNCTSNGHAGMATSVASSNSHSINNATSTTSTAVAGAFAAVRQLTYARQNGSALLSAARCITEMPNAAHSWFKTFWPHGLLAKRHVTNPLLPGCCYAEACKKPGHHPSTQVQPDAGARRAASTSSSSGCRHRHFSGCCHCDCISYS